MEGSLESTLIKINKSRHQTESIESLVDSLSYSNDLKVECVSIFKQKGLQLEKSAINNCISKMAMAEKLMAKIDEKIQSG